MQLPWCLVFYCPQQEQEAVINDKIRTNNMVDKEKSTRDCTIMVFSLACPNIK